MDYHYIDETILKGLWAINGNSKLIVELIELYRAGLTETIEQIVAAANRQHSRDLPGLLHRLRGSSANIGAQVLNRSLQKIELSLAQLQQGRDLSDLIAELSQLQNIVAKTLAELDRLQTEFH